VFAQTPRLRLHAPKRLDLLLFFTGNVLILKVGYALKCNIVLNRGGKKIKDVRIFSFFFSFYRIQALWKAKAMETF